MPLFIDADLEAAILKIAGIDPATIDPGSIDIQLINPDEKQPTTVRFTRVVAVPTVALKAAIAASVAPTQ